VAGDQKFESAFRQQRVERTPKLGCCSPVLRPAMTSLGEADRLMPAARAASIPAGLDPGYLFDLRALGIIREPASGCPPSKPSGKVPDTHSVGSICDHDFGVFTVTNIATENTDAVPPAHPVPRMPKAAN
jgi:hypothetical protein